MTALAQYATGNESLKPTDNVPPEPPKDCGQPGLISCKGGGNSCSVTSGLWTNPPHTATDTLGNSDPQLSLIHGAMSVSADGTSLRVLLNVSDLSETVPTGAAADEWYGLWSYNGTEYFGNAQLTDLPGATPTFDDGTVTNTGGENSYNTVNTDDTGLFTLGTNGVVEIDVPLANVGSPADGTVLASPAGKPISRSASLAVEGSWRRSTPAGRRATTTWGAGLFRPEIASRALAILLDGERQAQPADNTLRSLSRATIPRSRSVQT